MAAFIGNSKEAIHVLLSFTVFCLTAFQVVQITICEKQGHILVRALRSIRTPDYAMVAPVPLNEPMYAPKVPFLGELSEGLNVGKFIRIRGYVPDGLTEFQFNLCSDCSNGPLQLHIGVRFLEGVVVRNSYENQQWKTEEKGGGIPFSIMKEFTVQIEVKPEAYFISVDEHPTWIFRHRMPYSSATELEIKGGPVVIWKIEYSDTKKLTNYEMVAPVKLNEPVYIPKVPFLGELSEGLSVGKFIRIQGYIPEDLTEFQINLCSDCSNGPLHLNIGVRFLQGVFVRNSYENSLWQTKETEFGIPFALKSEFYVEIEVKPEAYFISVNGHHTWTFAHRVPYSSADRLEIKGGPVMLWKIEYTDKPLLNQEASIKLRATESELKIDVKVNVASLFKEFTVDFDSVCTP